MRTLERSMNLGRKKTLIKEWSSKLRRSYFKNKSKVLLERLRKEIASEISLKKMRRTSSGV